MFLTINIGNSVTLLGVMEGEKILHTCSMNSRRSSTSDEAALMINSLLGMRGVDPSEIQGAILSSAVPDLSNVFSRAVAKLCGVTPFLADGHMDPMLTIGLDEGSQISGSITAGVTAAIRSYPTPLVVIDMGTATILSVVDRDNCYRGGMIIPGMGLALNALSSGTSQLPHISLDSPGPVIATDTVSRMKAGSILGTASTLDECILRIEEELGESVTVVATGKQFTGVAPHCRRKILYDADLTLRGLGILYRLHQENS